MSRVRVVGLRAEHGGRLAVGRARPRLSWRAETEVAGWRQVAYQAEVDGTPVEWVDDDDSVFRPWPGEPLESRARVAVRVRVRDHEGHESDWSEPLVVETALLDPEDWTASWISPAAVDEPDRSAPGRHLRREFDLVGAGDATIARARLHVTSAGAHRAEVNGEVVGDHVLAPGWSAYRHRLRFDTHDVTDLVRPGPNVLGATLGDGWWRGHLGFDGRRNVYGDRLALIAQLEVEWSDRSRTVVGSDETWLASEGPILASDLYDGETFDARRTLDGWSTPGFDAAGWSPVERFRPDVGELVVPDAPPVRRIDGLPVAEVLTSPSGACILDFGQNLVGWVRFTVAGEAGTEVVLRHAEVLEAGELAIEPLRSAKATDRYVLAGGSAETWEPSFTFHGFRYVEVQGWPGPVDPQAFTAGVVHSDMERTGSFECSDELLDRFHENVVWGMRGNFLDVPTDCPQRDERLGWTGDLQVFAPTASYLYDVDGFLADWLADLRAEQSPDGTVPHIVPMVPGIMLPPGGTAAWSDAATVVPMELHRRYADEELLGEQFDSMRAWVDHVAERAGVDRIWSGDYQWGDWLDPTAPNDRPWQGRTDPSVVATAWFARSAQLVAAAAEALGRTDDADAYRGLAEEIATAFRREFLTPAGRLMSDSTTAYALALAFDLVVDPPERASCERNLVRTVRESFFTITTGFVGTPLVLPALTAAGRIREAYALMLQTERPSWLYAVTMGATTVWERWDSLLPDGSVNGSGMTSFNHYAFGCAAQWLHETVAGLAPGAAGMRRLRIAPEPGGGLTHAAASLRTPYGPAHTRWEVVGTQVRLDVEVPPNCDATVRLPGTDDVHDVGAGRHHWTYEIDVEIAEQWRSPASPWSE